MTDDKKLEEILHKVLQTEGRGYISSIHDRENEANLFSPKLAWKIMEEAQKQTALQIFEAIYGILDDAEDVVWISDGCTLHDAIENVEIEILGNNKIGRKRLGETKEEVKELIKELKKKSWYCICGQKFSYEMFCKLKEVEEKASVHGVHLVKICSSCGRTGPYDRRPPTKEEQKSFGVDI